MWGCLFSIHFFGPSLTSPLYALFNITVGKSYGVLFKGLKRNDRANCKKWKAHAPPVAYIINGRPLYGSVYGEDKVSVSGAQVSRRVRSLDRGR